MKVNDDDIYNKGDDKLCEENLIDFINNQNIDVNCLGVKKLHLSKKGSAIFACNLIDYMEQFY